MEPCRIYHMILKQSKPGIKSLVKKLSEHVKNNTALQKKYDAVINTRYVMSAGIERRTKYLSMSDTSKYTQYNVHEQEVLKK